MRVFRILAVLWMVAIAYGVHALMVYKGVSGPAGSAVEWPKNNSIPLPSERPLLVMVAHPRCPCTRASLGELQRLMAKAPDAFEAAIVFHDPAGAPLDGSGLPMIQSAKETPQLRVVLDENGSLARSLNAETSGHTMVFSPAGKLLFSGGITGSRGHMGDNAGADAALAAIQRSASESRQPWTAKVFGCEIFN